MFWLAEMTLILHPALIVSQFCINHSMYWLNRIRLMMLRFDIRFDDKITQKKNESWLARLLCKVLKPMFGHISAESNNALCGREVWPIKTHLLKQISKQSVISLILFNQYMEWLIKTGQLKAQSVISISFQKARTTSFQINNKAILSGISVFILIKQGYINKTAFPWNLPILCIILFIVPFRILVTSAIVSSTCFENWQLPSECWNHRL